MNFEDVEKTIQSMLAVQRELQESQLQLHETQLRQNKALETLLNLHISHETTHLDIEERILRLTQRMNDLER